ncbi:MAG: FAD-dependent oxidoreductase [Fimbriimonadales bacterium]|nr:FAD-dependent oxidoreductase [Fimbriimonadales bacterium]
MSETTSGSPSPGTPSREEIRVGVYVCHCGGNISDVVDVAKVVEEVGRHPSVEVSKHFPFLCSDPGQQLILEDIRRNGVNRVVVSACSPFLHETTFRKALQRAGLNPYLYEHVNVREQVSWVHKAKRESATEKAIRLTLAGVEKVARQDPLEAIRVQAEPHVVVIGAGIAGMRAAVSAARRGLRVTLIEKSDRTGGRLNELATLYPDNESARAVVDDLTQMVVGDGNIDLCLNSRLTMVDGYVGSFTVGFETRGPEGPILRQVRAGAIILATGFRHYEPFEGELGYGQSPDVMTLPEFNRALESTPPGDLPTFGGRRVRHVAFVHCVGSRQIEGVHRPQPDGRVNDYCSRVCCTAALHSIHRLMDKHPGVRVFDVYRDIRTYGRGHEDLYEKASKRGVLFFRHTEENQPTVELQASQNGHPPHRIRVRDVLTWNEEVEIPVDLVVLATGMMPSDIGGIVQTMKLPVGSDRFLQEVHPKLRPVEVANNGVFLAGTCQGPMDAVEAVAAGEAAAVKASILLSKGVIEMDPFVARVREERCDGCALCLNECEYRGALAMAESADGRKVARVNPALCAGCGACAAVCEPRAIEVAGWSLDQFDAMVDALVSR